MKFCKDCVHVEVLGKATSCYWCNRALTFYQDPVTGDRIETGSRQCMDERSNEGLYHCGPEGQYFIKRRPWWAKWVDLWFGGH
jgi:hypothetical protein